MFSISNSSLDCQGLADCGRMNGMQAISKSKIPQRHETKFNTTPGLDVKMAVVIYSLPEHVFDLVTDLDDYVFVGVSLIKAYSVI